jgi:hypothetical protein
MLMDSLSHERGHELRTYISLRVPTKAASFGPAPPISNRMLISHEKTLSDHDHDNDQTKTYITAATIGIHIRTDSDGSSLFLCHVRTTEMCDSRNPQKHLCEDSLRRSRYVCLQPVMIQYCLSLSPLVNLAFVSLFSRCLFERRYD